MGTDYIEILKQVSEAVGIAMNLLGQGPGFVKLAMAILETVKTDPAALDMEKIHADVQALKDLPLKEE